MAGLLDQAKQWMTPERAIGMRGLGMALSQLGAGQPVNLSPAYEALDQRKQLIQMQKIMEQPGALSKFSPQQRAALAAMPESLATKIIMESMFAPAPEPTKGISVDGKVIDPISGRVIYEGEQKAPERKTATGPDGVLRYLDTEEPVFPGVEGAPEVPTTKNVTLSDGSEVMVQWNPETEAWDPAPIPQGGAGAQPKTKLTETQAKTTLFQSMQTETAPVLEEIERAWDPANMQDAAARSIPIAGNFFQSTQGQIYSVAAAAWAEGALRISTGAAATQPEIERVQATYFAVPGDTPATIEFKRSMRAMYKRAIERSLGGAGGGGALMLPLDFAEIVGAPVGEMQGPPMNRDDALKILEGN